MQCIARVTHDIFAEKYRINQSLNAVRFCNISVRPASVPVERRPQPHHSC